MPDMFCGRTITIFCTHNPFLNKKTNRAFPIFYFNLNIHILLNLMPLMHSNFTLVVYLIDWHNKVLHCVWV